MLYLKLVQVPYIVATKYSTVSLESIATWFDRPTDWYWNYECQLQFSLHDLLNWRIFSIRERLFNVIGGNSGEDGGGYTPSLFRNAPVNWSLFRTVTFASRGLYPHFLHKSPLMINVTNQQTYPMCPLGEFHWFRRAWPRVRMSVGYGKHMEKRYYKYKAFKGVVWCQLCPIPSSFQFLSVLPYTGRLQPDTQLVRGKVKFFIFSLPLVVKVNSKMNHSPTDVWVTVILLWLLAQIITQFVLLSPTQGETTWSWVLLDHSYCRLCHSEVFSWRVLD